MDGRTGKSWQATRETWGNRSAEKKPNAVEGCTRYGTRVPVSQPSELRAHDTRRMRNARDRTRKEDEPPKTFRVVCVQAHPSFTCCGLVLLIDSIRWQRRRLRVGHDLGKWEGG